MSGMGRTDRRYLSGMPRGTQPVLDRRADRTATTATGAIMVTRAPDDEQYDPNPSLRRTTERLIQPGVRAGQCQPVQIDHNVRLNLTAMELTVPLPVQPAGKRRRSSHCGRWRNIALQWHAAFHARRRRLGRYSRFGGRLGSSVGCRPVPMEWLNAGRDPRP